MCSSSPFYGLLALHDRDCFLLNGSPHRKRSPSCRTILRHLNIGHGRRHRILCSTVQPARNFQQVARKVAPGLEGITRRGSNGFLLPEEWRCVPDIWWTAAQKFGDNTALVDPHHTPFTKMTYSQLHQTIVDFAEGLRLLGILPNEKVALFADNSCRWLVADQGVMAVGAIGAVRGTKSSLEELKYIYIHSNSVALVVDNYELFAKLSSSLQPAEVKFVVLLWGQNPHSLQGLEQSGFNVLTYDEVISQGKEFRNLPNTENTVVGQPEHIDPDDVATLVYTSGTTGNPKGVMLTHANLLHQIRHMNSVVELRPGDRFVSLLPPWHMYERSCEYFSLSNGIEQVYTNVKRLKEDLKVYSPDYLVSVPLVYEILYSGIQKQLLSASNVRRFVAITLIRISMMYKEWKRLQEGKALAKAKIQPSAISSACEWVAASIITFVLFPLHVLAKHLVYRKIYAAVGIKKAGISGGGSLASHIDKFFEAIDITILNGYGLTESSPVVSARVPANNILGTVGKPLPETEIKVVDPDSGLDVPHGTRGLVKVRGPQIMKGYYKDSSATAKVVDMNGWLDTGDLGWIAPDREFGAARSCGGTLVVDGRAKDTIVLTTGENIDPTHIEEAALQSRYIQQIMVVGQDQRRLGALILANFEELQAQSVAVSETETLIRQELNKYITDRAVSIGPFYLLSEPFSVDNGLLTPTMKMKRNTIAEKYQSEIDALFGRHG